MSYTTAHDLLTRVEDHTGHKIEPKRLRFHLACALQREIDKHTSLESRIAAVLGGSAVYDPKTHKAIQRSTK